MMTKLFSQDQLEAIAGALGDTEDGLTNSEIAYLFQTSKMADPGPNTKRHRIYNAFVQSQNTKQSRANILAFIRQSMKPAKYIKNPERYELMRANLNKALVFAGLVVNEQGELSATSRAKTLSEAELRAKDLRHDLELRSVHPDVLKFCKAELLANDYFHAVHESVKSIASKIRDKTGLVDDGASLIDKALNGKSPLLAINSLNTVSEKSEQSGFANLIRGTFGMFRNTTAHEARIHWPMDKKDAEDILTIVSMIHRRLDTAHKI
ncbi:MAG: TIGR02391 family protein [Cohaesibacter sp.]|nr:TIGR02391 family protein [Cohaesibacter sp.]